MGTPINSYAAGSRRYLGSGRAPNVGATANKSGYNSRDLRREAQQRAFAERLQKLRPKIPGIKR